MPITTSDLGATAATARSGRDSSSGTPVVSPGDTIGARYVVEEVLGSGGMGVVVAARHVALGHRVAMKFISAPAADAEAYARFSREARLIASIESDHVVRVIDFGQHAGSPYMVMDLLAGRDLGRELAMRGPLPVSEAVDYLIQACDGLWSTHAKGIVHRDVKLANLFLATRADGERIVKVLDFGVSKPQADAQEDVSLTRTATMIGSPLYMSPEQIRDPRRVDERADVWSLGVVLHKLLTDEAPFTGLSTNAVCAAIAADPPTPLRSHATHLPRELEAAVLRCLEKRPERRYASVALLARDLAPFASEAGAAMARQLLARATDDDPRTPGTSGVALPDASLGATVAALPTLDGSADAPPPRRSLLWTIPAALAVAGAFGFFLARSPSPGLAAPSAPATSTIEVQPEPAADHARGAPVPATPDPGATVAAPPAPAPGAGADTPALQPKPRHPPPRHAAPAPHAVAPPSSKAGFGGSALDEHQ